MVDSSLSNYTLRSGRNDEYLSIKFFITLMKVDLDNHLVSSGMLFQIFAPGKKHEDQWRTHGGGGGVRGSKHPLLTTEKNENLSF